MSATDYTFLDGLNRNFKINSNLFYLHIFKMGFSVDGIIQTTKSSSAKLKKLSSNYYF